MPGLIPAATDAGADTAATPVEPGTERRARIRVLDGPAAGHEAELLKAVTTLGKPGIAVVTIARHEARYQLQWLEGQSTPQVNCEPLGPDPVPLEHEDLIELAGTRLQFLQA